MSETPVKYGTDNDRDPIRSWLGQVPPEQEPEDREIIEAPFVGSELDALVVVANSDFKGDRVATIQHAVALYCKKRMNEITMEA